MRRPATTPDTRLDPHALTCPYRVDEQLATQHGLFRLIDRACACGLWSERAESDGGRREDVTESYDKDFYAYLHDCGPADWRDLNQGHVEDAYEHGWNDGHARGDALVQEWRTRAERAEQELIDTHAALDPALDRLRADNLRLRAALDALPCPRCDGVGTLRGGDGPSWRRVLCDACGGWGKHRAAQAALAATPLPGGAS